MPSDLPPETTANNRQGKFFFGWYLPAAACVMTICYSILMIYGFGAYLPAIIEETGWSRAEASAVYGLIGAEVGLLAPLYGFIVNRFGARIPTTIGSILAGTGLILMSQMDSLLSFYLSFGLAGLGFAVYYFGPIAAITNWFNKNRALALGIVLAGSSLCGLMVPGLQWAVETFGWRPTIFGGGVVTLLLCVPLSLVLRFRPEPYGYTVDGEDQPQPAEQETKASEEKPKLDLKKAVGQPVYWLLAGMYAAVFAGFAGVLPHMFVFFKDVGIPESVGALSFIGYAVTSTIGRVGGGMLADRFDKRKVIAWASLAFGAGMLGTAFASEAWHLAFFVLLLAPGFAVVAPTIPALIADIYGERSFALIYALVLFPGMLLSLVAAGVTGWIADSYGSYQLAFFIAAGMGWTAIAMALKISKSAAAGELTLPTKQTTETV